MIGPPVQLSVWKSLCAVCGRYGVRRLRRLLFKKLRKGLVLRRHVAGWLARHAKIRTVVLRMHPDSAARGIRFSAGLARKGGDPVYGVFSLCAAAFRCL